MAVEKRRVSRIKLENTRVPLENLTVSSDLGSLNFKDTSELQPLKRALSGRNVLLRPWTLGCE